jgi:hypothetical protein
MYSGFSCRTMYVAGLVALVYTALAVLAAGCLLSHAAHAGVHENHESQEAVPHNALCAWACQGTSEVGLVAEPPALSTGQAVRLPAVFPHRTFLSASSFPLHSRAPPSVPFAFIG